MAKKKSWLAVVGVAVAALLTVGVVSALFPQKKPCDHVWDEGKVAVEATCGTNGKKIFSCSDCGEVKTEIIKATGDHQNIELKGTDDVAVGTCYDCGVNLTELQYELCEVGLYELEDDTWYRYDLRNEYEDWPLELSFDFEWEIPGRKTQSWYCFFWIEDNVMYYSADGEINVLDADGEWIYLGEFSVATEALPWVFSCENYLYFYTGSDLIVEVEVNFETSENGTDGKYNGTVVSWTSEYPDGLAKLVG